MKARLASVLALALSVALALPAQASGSKTLCTVVADAATGSLIVEEGDCAKAVMPASTFKIPLALMGYDAGILKDEHDPTWPFKKGYPDWIVAWRTDTDPAAWMKNSVLWYSQEITRTLGAKRFRDYVEAFDYGNRDVSGEPGKDDGLTRSWLGSSLTISPAGQLEFLRRIVRRDLPVSKAAFDYTTRLVDQGAQPGGWHLYGKTGSGLPRGSDGKPMRGRAYGWFVGWAVKGERTVVFARLIQDTRRHDTAPGPRTRDSVIRDLFTEAGAF